MRKRFVLGVIAAMFAACDNGMNPDDVSIVITPDSVAVEVGQVVSLSVLTAHTTQRPTFTSSNNAVATVDTMGRVTSKSAGMAYVVGTIGSARDSSKIVVTAPPPTLDLRPDSLVLSVGQTRVVTPTITNTQQSSVAYTSSNANIASVDGNGAVTAKAVGNTFVVATMGALRDSSKIIVTAALPTPATIPLLGSGNVPERISAEVTAAGGWAYTTTWGNRTFNGVSNPGNTVKIWNVSGNTPILSDSLVITGAGTTSDVQISDDGTLLAVSTEGGTPSVRGFSLYSMATPAKPTLITRFNSPATSPGVHTLKFGRVNGRHYLLLNIDPPAALVVVDITTPSAPVQVGSFPMGNPFIHDVFFRDGLLFAGLWNDGMSIFDMGGGNKGGSPSNPVLIGNVRTASCGTLGCGGSRVHNIWWFHDPKTGSKKYAFIGEEADASLFTNARGDIHVVDVSDMSNPKEVAFFRPDSASSSTGNQPSGTHNFDVDEQSGVLYAAYYNGGVRALDIRGDLSTCTAAQKSADGRCNLRLMGREIGVGLTSFPTFIWGVKLDGNFLYASDMPNGIHKLNISGLKR
ncbi:MAG TPA: Ig-like domain-containing protein [Longimicrobiales bacterium]|nr:Ig-like domain-containing protein [Longimicrobiales bacterium]